MNSIIETEAVNKYMIPFGQSFPLTITPMGATTSGVYSDQFITIPEEKSIIRPVINSISKIENHDVAIRAREFINDFQTALETQNQLQVEFLPPLYLFPVDDGSSLIEWIFDDFRIGFSIDPVPNESSWYLATNKELGQISASGYLNSENFILIQWLLHFISNYI